MLHQNILHNGIYPLIINNNNIDVTPEYAHFFRISHCRQNFEKFLWKSTIFLIVRQMKNVNPHCVF